MYKILLADSDQASHFIIQNVLTERLGCDVTYACDGQEAILHLSNEEETKPFDLIIVDVFLPNIDGIDVINFAKRKFPDMEILALTSERDLKLAEEAIEKGACEYIKKADSPKRITQTIKSALQGSKLRSKFLADDSRITFDNIIGTSDSLSHVIKQAKQGANSSIPIILQGESGVGKEIFAKAIHAASPRTDKPFIAINCGAIPENLVESTLFGHEKGSFTGAIGKAIGKFQEADGGTIFLDEVGELKPDIQVKLLRTLQEGEINPVGSSKTKKVDVRIISATNINLVEAIANKNFREDLFYRLNVLPIHLPSLKQRSHDDITALLQHFLSTICTKENKKINGFSDEALELLKNYNWPGNVRQLENTIFRAVVLSQNDILDADDFTQISNSFLQKQEIEETTKISEIFTYSTEDNIQTLTSDGQIRRIIDIEKDLIEKALQHYHWQISKAAKQLGICRATLYRKMEQYKIIDPRYN